MTIPPQALKPEVQEDIEQATLSTRKSPKIMVPTTSNTYQRRHLVTLSSATFELLVLCRL
jgi:hypothetical protein